jgi:hypothetical protein
MYRAGDENSTLYVLDVDSGRWLADEIPGRSAASTGSPTPPASSTGTSRT